MDKLEAVRVFEFSCFGVLCCGRVLYRGLCGDRESELGVQFRRDRNDVDMAWNELLEEPSYSGVNACTATGTDRYHRRDSAPW